MDYFEILPEEITLDILTRLPAESVLDSKLVCTNWRNLVSHHPLFSKMHLNHLNHPSDSAEDSGMSGFLAWNDEIFYYFEYNENHDTSTNPIQRIRTLCLTLPFQNFWFVGSLNGLVCLAESLFVCICNPFTREYVALPEIKSDYEYVSWTAGFGYVSSTNEYKVVGIYEWKTEFIEVYVYTLGSGNGWRNLGNFASQLVSISNLVEAGIFANGALYWLDDEFEMILTFDLAEEKFCKHLSPPPFPQHSDWCDNTIGVLDGFLFFALGLNNVGYEVNDIWILKRKNHYHDKVEGRNISRLFGVREFRIEGRNLLAITKNDGVLTYGGFYLNVYDTKNSTLQRLLKFEDWFRQVHPHKNTFVSLKELGEEDTKVG